MYIKRGKMELSRWLLRFDLETLRMKNAWMDLFVPTEELNASVGSFIAALPEDDRPTGRAEKLELYNRDRKQAHEDRFRFASDVLKASMFLVMSELTDGQIALLIQHLKTHSNVRIEDVGMQVIEDAMQTLMIETRTGLDNPNLENQPGRRHNGLLTFTVHEEGFFDDEYAGDWVTCEDDDTEGFLDLYEDAFLLSG